MPLRRRTTGRRAFLAAERSAGARFSSSLCMRVICGRKKKAVSDVLLNLSMREERKKTNLLVLQVGGDIGSALLGRERGSVERTKKRGGVPGL